MRASLSLECIGDNHVAANRGRKGTFLDTKPRQPWCAKLVDYDEALDRFTREFLSGQKDYSSSNGQGSRGVMRYFWLESGSVYEVHELTSWTRSRRWYAAVSDTGEVIEITRDQAISCLE